MASSDPTPRLSPVLLAGALVLGVPATATAAVVAVTTDALEVHETGTVAAAPDRVWTVLVAPARWWDPAHSFGGDAAALTLDPRPGGCFCERLPGGGVEHMRVVYAAPAKLLRMSGALGPFQGDAVTGTMTIELRPAGAGTAVDLTYRLSGQRSGGFVQVAPVVDAVLAGQLARLKRAAEPAR